MACSQNNNGLHAIPEPRTVFMVCQMKSINIVASALAPMSVSFQQRSQDGGKSKVIINFKQLLAQLN